MAEKTTWGDVGRTAVSAFKKMGEDMASQGGRGRTQNVASFGSTLSGAVGEVKDAVAKTRDEIENAAAKRALKETVGPRTVSLHEAPIGTEVLGSRKKGGRIQKTGVYRLHKGEFVIPAKDAKRIEKRKTSRKSGRR